MLAAFVRTVPKSRKNLPVLGGPIAAVCPARGASVHPESPSRTHEGTATYGRARAGEGEFLPSLSL